VGYFVPLEHRGAKRGIIGRSVYDVRGSLVSQLVDLSSGDGIIRTTPWLTDDAPSGIYFATRRGEGGSLTRKIVVTK
jgi:hypothetical protein